jgi:NADPH:quinone reductase-like Zn-dependent oxidoreductase
VVQHGPADLLFDTAGGDLSGSDRVVTIAAETAGATYFVVEPDRAQLLELGRLADTGAIRPTIDTVFPLTHALDAFDRLAVRGKNGKVVLEIER